MATEAELATLAMLQSAVSETLTAWFNDGVEFVALSNRIPVETIKDGEPPCRVQSARLRGLQVLHLVDDMEELSEAIIHTTNHVCADALADLEAQGFAALPRARGMA